MMDIDTFNQEEIKHLVNALVTYYNVSVATYDPDKDDSERRLIYLDHLDQVDRIILKLKNNL